MRYLTLDYHHWSHNSILNANNISISYYKYNRYHNKIININYTEVSVRSKNSKHNLKLLKRYKRKYPQNYNFLPTQDQTQMKGISVLPSHRQNWKDSYLPSLPLQPSNLRTAVATFSYTYKSSHFHSSTPNFPSAISPTFRRVYRRQYLHDPNPFWSEIGIRRRNPKSTIHRNETHCALTRNSAWQRWHSLGLINPLCSILFSSVLPQTAPFPSFESSVAVCFFIEPRRLAPFVFPV